MVTHRLPWRHGSDAAPCCRQRSAQGWLPRRDRTIAWVLDGRASRRRGHLGHEHKFSVTSGSGSRTGRWPVFRTRPRATRRKCKLSSGAGRLLPPQQPFVSPVFRPRDWPVRLPSGPDRHGKVGWQGSGRPRTRVHLAARWLLSLPANHSSRASTRFRCSRCERVPVFQTARIAAAGGKRSERCVCAHHRLRSIHCELMNWPRLQAYSLNTPMLRNPNLS